jgi:Family of unknown function (DUF6165)
MAEDLRTLSKRPRRSRPIPVETAPGELIDKITILEIKSERMVDAGKLRNVRAEMASLRQTRDRAVSPSWGLSKLTEELKAVNERLWEIEDEIRACEQQSEFGARFIELARSVYRENDRRAQLKRQINELLGSTLVEEKSYADYQR